MPLFDVERTPVVLNGVSLRTYSIVVPIFNEEQILPELLRRLDSVVAQLDSNAEILFVDDGSTDTSLELIRGYCDRDNRVRYISFARNIGHQIAVTAGLKYSCGEAVVVIDADLQDPPELILSMAQKWRQGYQVVYAQRSRRKEERWLKRVTAYLFYRFLRSLASVDVPADTGDFCLMDRRVVDILNSIPERNRYVRGLRSWVGFRQVAVQFDRDPRFAGEPKYTFRKSFRLAVNSIVGFSLVPLRLATYTGLIAAAGAIVMALLVLYWRLTQAHSPVAGHTIIAMAYFFLGAAQLICVGILGEYIGRIHDEVKGRPLYTLQESGEHTPSETFSRSEQRKENRTTADTREELKPVSVFRKLNRL